MNGDIFGESRLQYTKRVVPPNISLSRKRGGCCWHVELSYSWRWFADADGSWTHRICRGKLQCGFEGGLVKANDSISKSTGAPAVSRTLHLAVGRLLRVSRTLHLEVGRLPRVSRTLHLGDGQVLQDKINEMLSAMQR